MAADPILPCPFCGGAAQPAHTSVWNAGCRDPECAAEGPLRSSQAEAVVAWNAAHSRTMARPQPPADPWQEFIENDDAGMTIALGGRLPDVE